MHEFATKRQKALFSPSSKHSSKSSSQPSLELEEEMPNARFQEVYDKFREIRSRSEIGTDEKLQMNLKMKAVFDDLDRNIKDISATIIAERYQKNVSKPLTLPLTTT